MGTHAVELTHHVPLRYMVRVDAPETLDGRCVVVADDAMVAQAYSAVRGGFFLYCLRCGSDHCEHVEDVRDFRRQAHPDGRR